MWPFIDIDNVCQNVGNLWSISRENLDILPNGDQIELRRLHFGELGHDWIHCYGQTHCMWKTFIISVTLKKYLQKYVNCSFTFSQKLHCLWEYYIEFRLCVCCYILLECKMFIVVFSSIVMVYCCFIIFLFIIRKWTWSDISHGLMGSLVIISGFGI